MFLTVLTWQYLPLVTVLGMILSSLIAFCCFTVVPNIAERGKALSLISCAEFRKTHWLMTCSHGMEERGALIDSESILISYKYSCPKRSFYFYFFLIHPRSFAVVSLFAVVLTGLISPILRFQPRLLPNHPVYIKSSWTNFHHYKCPSLEKKNYAP